MAFNIGDAVMNFMADTSQLDASVEQIGAKSTAALEPVKAEVASVGEALSSVAEQATATAEAMGVAASEEKNSAAVVSDAQMKVARATYENQVAQTSLRNVMRQVHATNGDVATIVETLAAAQQRAAQTAEALAIAQKEVGASGSELGQQVSSGGREAKAEIALLGEEIGVKLPRHLRGFVSELPGVGSLLNAAFSTTAVLMLVQIFPELVEKIGDAASAMAGWDEKAKKTYDDLIEGNRKLIIEQLAMRQAQRETADMGLTGQAKYSAELKTTQENLKDVASVNASFLSSQQKNQEELKGLTTGWALWKGVIWNTLDGSSERVKELNSALAGEGPIIEQLTAQMKKMGDEDAERRKKEADVSAQSDARSLASSQISASKSVSDAKLAAQALFFKEEYQLERISYDQEIAGLKQVENQKFEVLMASIERRKALAHREEQETGKSSAPEVTTLNAQAESAAIEHQAKLKEIDTSASIERKHQADAVSQAQIAAELRSGEATVALAEQTATRMFVQHQIDAQQETQQLLVAENLRYEVQKEALAKRLVLAQTEPQKNKALVITLNSEIEALATQHESRLERIHEQGTQAALRESKLQTEFAVEQLNNEQALLRMRIAAQDAFYQWQAANGRISSARLIQLKQEQLAQEYRLERQAVQQQLSNDNLTQLEKQKLTDKLGQLDLTYFNNRAALLRQERTELQKTYDLEMKAAGAVSQYVQAWKQGAPTLQQTFQHLKESASQMFDQMMAAEASAVSSWILGQESLGAAMEKATAQVLAQYAGRAAVEALYWTAYGFAMLASFNFDEAADAFTAAGLLAAFAGVAGASAYGLNSAAGGNSSGSGSGSSTAATPASGNGITGSSSTASSNPVQSTNVHRFAAGGLISQPTLAVIGDSIQSASQGAREGVLPLDDPQAMSQIAEAIVSRMGGGGGGGVTHINMPNVRGVISSDVLDSVIDQVNTRVQGGKRLLASEARRTVRRS